MWGDAGVGHRHLTPSVARYDENGPIRNRNSASHHITMLHYPGLLVLKLQCNNDYAALQYVFNSLGPTYSD
jgi:hypothetical protein